jgi:hypothetical protein
MALQAADLIAREAFKHADNWGVRKTRKPVKRLQDRICFIMWTRPCLEYLREHGGPHNSNTLANWGQNGEAAPNMIRLWRDGFSDEEHFVPIENLSVPS